MSSLPFNPNVLKALASKQDLLDLEGRLEHLLRSNHTQLGDTLSKMECLMVLLAEQLSAELGRINASTTEMGEDITDAIAKLSDSPTPAEVAEVKAQLGDIATRLEQTAAKYPATGGNVPPVNG